MMYNIVTHNNLEFLKVSLIEVIQKEKRFFVSKIGAKEFIKIFTVRPAKYDVNIHQELADSFSTEKEYFNHLVDQDNESLKKKDFQRNYDPSRLSQISKFLLEEEYAFFPNTIISTCELINDQPEHEFDEGTSFSDFVDLYGSTHFAFLQKIEEEYNLFIPYKENTVLVIDGQHRLEGLKKSQLYLEYNYELLVSFIIGFDRSVIAKQFYTINYEQKSVNKSLLYQLTGEFSLEINELTYLHNVVKILNEVSESPFNRRIKMLGSNPPNATIEDKRLLSISQAFLIDWLMKTLSKSSINSNYQPIFLYYFKQKSLRSYVINFIIEFFSAIKELKNDWDHPELSLLSKGMGVGAFIRVMQIFYVVEFVTKFGKNPEEIINVKRDYIKTKLEGIQNVNLLKEGPFGGTGSSGSVSRITEEIINKVECFREDDFIEYFKSNYKPIFSKWLKKNI